MNTNRLGKWLTGMGLVTLLATGGGMYHIIDQQNRISAEYHEESQICQKYTGLEKDLQRNDNLEFTVPEARKNYQEAREKHQQAVTLELKALEPSYENAQKRLKERDEKLPITSSYALGSVCSTAVGTTMTISGMIMISLPPFFRKRRKEINNG
ncbi:hypothetical protein GOV03_04345 [Candidatus Woesearchaeota archaeon]|nr:hypothetical protein [Candidatus Woesearchaeota archaeon]